MKSNKESGTIVRKKSDYCPTFFIDFSQFRWRSVRNKKTRVSTRGRNSFSDKSLAHTRWDCKYHIVFTPKYRRKVIYGKLRVSIGQILRKLCERKDVEIIEAHAMPDHIHMLVRIPPKISISSFMGYLKGRSATLIHEKHANLKYKYGNKSFWTKGYYVSTVGLNQKQLKYIFENKKQMIELETV